MTKEWRTNESVLTDWGVMQRQYPDVDPDDDPPSMPSLDLALARIEAESPAAATAARAYLDGSEGKSTSIRVRVTVAEHAQIQQAAKALGYASMSEYMRARALA